MALIVEDGSVVPNANSYVTVSDMRAWALARGFSLESDEKVEQHVLRGMDYLEQQNFLGLKANQAQALQWPRHGVWIDGYPVNSTEIPKQLKNALYELALADHQGDSLTAPEERQTLSESIGGISVTYAANAPMRRSLPAVRLALSKLVYSNSTVARA